MTRLIALCLLALTGTAQATPAPAHCPQAGPQLDELLASTMTRHGREGEVRLEFSVDASGRAEARSVVGPRPYAGAVRRAVEALQCQPGEPHLYAIRIRFDAPPSRPPERMASR
ncbi:MAG: TonB family protein [Roseateles sp.]|nr:MAG: TonB family protein [Roseateles sp.]